MCSLGEFCPNWLGWTSEIGSLIAFLDTHIADLTEQRAKVYDDEGRGYLDHEAIKYIEGQIAAFELIRDKL